MSKFPTPRNELVIVKPDKEGQEQQSGGVIIPEELNEKPKTGTVMIASKGYYAKETGVFIPIELKQGDRVMYNPFAGGVIKFEGEPYLLMDEKEIKLKIN